MAKQKPKFSNMSCSDEFALAFLTQGAQSIDCQACNRTHFNASEPKMFEEGEFDDLMAKHNEDPDAYIPNDGTVNWGHLMGKQIVYGCPCRFDGFYEQEIWDSRFAIRDYLVRHLEKEERALKLTKESIRIINNIVK